MPLIPDGQWKASYRSSIVILFVWKYFGYRFFVYKKKTGLTPDLMKANCENGMDGQLNLEKKDFGLEGKGTHFPCSRWHDGDWKGVQMNFQSALHQLAKNIRIWLFLPGTTYSTKPSWGMYHLKRIPENVNQARIWFSAFYVLKACLEHEACSLQPPRVLWNPQP